MKNNMFKLNLKRFFNNKLMMISMIAFIVLSVGYLIYEVALDLAFDDRLFLYIIALWKTNEFSIYSFAFFIFISFEFSSRLYICNLYEMAYCTPKKLISLSLSNICVLNFWNIFYCLILLVFNFSAFLSLHSVDGNYLIHIILNIFINFFLINTLAILFGQAVSFFKSKILSYLAMIVFLIAGSPIGEFLLDNTALLFSNELNAYAIFNLFYLYTPNLDFTPTYAIGFSVLPYRVYLILFWIFLMIAVIAFYLKRKKINLKQIVPLVLCILSLFAFLAPDSRLILYADHNGELIGNFYYYLNRDTVEKEEADFTIESYNIDIKINRRLNAIVTMKPDKSLSSYTFTLYHGYEIKEVTDQDDNKLKFTREDDYVTVNGSEKVSEITIKYSGSGKNCFSNYQGIYLRGDFPYYPVAGKNPLYKDQELLAVVPENTPYFKINMSSNLHVYSNLDTVEENSFSGNTKAPCLLAGPFLTEIEYNGVRVIYPYLCGEYDLFSDEYSLVEYFSDNYFSNENAGKTVFITPNTNAHFIGGEVYDDVVLR